MRHQRAPLPLGLVSAQHWTDGGKEERKDRVLGGAGIFSLDSHLVWPQQAGSGSKLLSGGGLPLAGSPLLSFQA